MVRKGMREKQKMKMNGNGLTALMYSFPNRFGSPGTDPGFEPNRPHLQPSMPNAPHSHPKAQIASLFILHTPCLLPTPPVIFFCRFHAFVNFPCILFVLYVIIIYQHPHIYFHVLLFLSLFFCSH